MGETGKRGRETRGTVGPSGVSVKLGMPLYGDAPRAKGGSDEPPGYGDLRWLGLTGRSGVRRVGVPRAVNTGRQALL